MRTTVLALLLSALAACGPELHEDPRDAAFPSCETVTEAWCESGCGSGPVPENCHEWVHSECERVPGASSFSWECVDALWAGECPAVGGAPPACQ